MNERQSLDNSSNELTPQELRLVDYAGRGQSWWPEISGDHEPDMDPANVATWNADRTIRAEVIRCLVTGDIWPGKGGPWPVKAKGIWIWGAQVKGEVDLEGAIIERNIWLLQCVFDAIINLIDAETKNLSFRGSHLSRGLVAVRANVGGHLYLPDCISTKGGVKLAGAKIEGQLYCTGGSFENAGGPALDGYGMTVGAGVLLSGGFSAKGLVDFRGAKIEGQLACDDGSFENAGGPALNGNSMTVGAGVFLRDRFSAKGLVDLRGAKIGGQLDCSGGSFKNTNGKALKGNCMIVGENVLLCDGFSAKGGVDLAGAKIGGQLDCSGGHFENAGGVALNGNGMTVGTAVHLREGFSTKGAVDLSGAAIGDAFFLIGLCSSRDSSHGIDGPLSLAQAKCRIYCDDSESWPEAGKLVLDGFVYERFHDCDTGWKCRREWLLRQTEDHLDGTFHPQPWTQAIKVLREMGHDSDAKELAVCREIARAKSKSTKLHIKIWHYLLRLFVGNGYKPERALYWSAGFVLIGWLVFATAGSLGYMAPRDGNVRVTWEWNETMVLPRTYPPFNGLVYALDAYLPVIEFGQDEAWEPSTEKTIPTIHAAPDRLLMRAVTLPDAFFTAGWHRVLYWVEEIAGWVLVSLFIAGMSGLMKKE